MFSSHKKEEKHNNRPTMFKTKCTIACGIFTHKKEPYILRLKPRKYFFSSKVRYSFV